MTQKHGCIIINVVHITLHVVPIYDKESLRNKLMLAPKF